jgi:signal transduction histidine kinase
MKQNSLGDFYIKSQRKTAASVVMLGCAVFLFGVVLQYREKSDALSREVKNISREVRGDLLSGNTAYVYEICRSLFGNNEFESLIVSKAGKNYCNLVKNNHSAFTITATTPITFDANDSSKSINPIGYVEIQVDAGIILTNLILNLLGLFSIVMVFYFTMRKLSTSISKEIISPINQFSSIMISNPRDIHAVNELKKQSKFAEMFTLASSYIQLLEQLSTVEQKLIDESKRAVLADISTRVAHDIRSPLSALNTIASSLDGSDDTYSSLIREVVKRISSIADDLLTVSRNNIEVSTDTALGPRSYLGSCYLLQTIESIIQQKRFEFTNRTNTNLVFKNSAPKGDFLVTISSSTLMRIISNLINNAADAGGDNGDIFIEAYASSNSAKVEITDFGCGIPQSILSQLTSRQITSNVNGNGIGVYSSSQYLSEVGGKLTYFSEVGLGTKVIIDIPIVTRERLHMC